MARKLVDLLAPSDGFKLASSLFETLKEHAQHHHDADQILREWGWELDKFLEKKRFEWERELLEKIQR